MEIEAHNIKTAWLELLEHIRVYGEPEADERGDNVLEVLNTTCRISFNHLSSYWYMKDTPKGCVWNEDRLSSYSNEFIEGENPEGFVYTYGERLRNPYDQISAVIRRLEDNPSTRRATMTTWQPANDLNNSEVPCMVLLDFKIRNHCLYVTGVWRSHDIYGAWYPNIVALANLSQYIADNCSTCVGLDMITVHSVSAHINRHNMDEAVRILELNGYGC